MKDKLETAAFFLPLVTDRKQDGYRLIIQYVVPFCSIYINDLQYFRLGFRDCLIVNAASKGLNDSGQYDLSGDLV